MTPPVQGQNPLDALCQQAAFILMDDISFTNS